MDGSKRISKDVYNKAPLLRGCYTHNMANMVLAAPALARPLQAATAPRFNSKLCFGAATTLPAAEPRRIELAMDGRVSATLTRLDSDRCISSFPSGETAIEKPPTQKVLWIRDVTRGWEGLLHDAKRKARKVVGPTKVAGLHRRATPRTHLSISTRTGAVS